MVTLRDRINAFFNPPALPIKGEGIGGGVAPVITEDPYARFKVERDRVSVVKDARAMYDGDPRVEKMHRDYARDILRNGFFVRTDNQQALQIIQNLQERLDLNQRLEDWLRLSMRDGDTFLELTAEQVSVNEFRLADVTRKPTLKMHRNTNSADKFIDPAKAFWMGDDAYYNGEAPADATWFPQWKIIHARWNHDEESRYGRPMMKSARKQFKYVEDGELNVAVRRKIGGAQLRHHVVEGSAADVEAYKEQNKAALGKLAAVIDFVSNKSGSMTVVQGDGTIDKIGDVKHHIETMYTASDRPMELSAYGSDLNRDILNEKREQYEDTLNQSREWAQAQIIKPLIEMEWLLHGILPAAVKYKIHWRKGKSIDPAQLTQLTDAVMKLKILGVKDEELKVILALYLRDIDLEILQGDGFSAEQFAQSLRGLSI